MRSITTVKDLESVVGTRVQMAMMKSIPKLDKHCVNILSQTPVGVLGCVGTDGSARATVVGGARGFVEVVSPGEVRVPVSDGVAPPDGTGVSTCFLLPGIGEPLRINGRAAGVDDGMLAVDVEEAFVHCGKCVYRAKLWDEPDAAAGMEADVPMFSTGPFADPEVVAFLTRAPFAVFSTWDGLGAADASPKGDPGGFIRILDECTIAIPDRKGNRRTDTFHNVVEHPGIAMIAVVPGDDRVLEISGLAFVTDDQDVLEPMAVQGSVPKAALIVTVDSARLQPSPAIASAQLWDAANHVSKDDVPNLIKVAAEHVAQNKSGGLLAGVTRSVSKVLAASGPVVEAGQKYAYEHDLY